MIVLSETLEGCAAGKGGGYETAQGSEDAQDATNHRHPPVRATSPWEPSLRTRSYLLAVPVPKNTETDLTTVSRSVAPLAPPHP